MFGFTIIRNESVAESGLTELMIQSVEDVVTAAFEYWGRYIEAPNANIEIDLSFASLAGNTLATAGPQFASIGGEPFFDIVNDELSTNTDSGPFAVDALLTVNTDRILDGSFFFDTSYEPNPTGIAFGQSDLLTVLTHEIGHALGFIGDFSTINTLFTANSQLIGNDYFFTGANAVAANGGQNILLDSSASGPTGHIAGIGDLLSAILITGERLPITPVHIGILEDLGINTVNESTGNDVLHGFEEFDDVLDGLAGDDTLFGYSGDDSLVGADGNDTLDGGLGNDTLDGGNGTDVANFNGNLADYTIAAISGGFTVTDNVGTDGTDTVLDVETFVFADTTLNTSSLLGNNIIDGTSGNDVLAGTIDADTINGFDGDDRLLGLAGDDTLDGGLGADFFSSGAGNDTIFGGDGDDRAFGGADNDAINGDAGNDDLRGGSGDDVINGGVGVDFLVGSNGNDTLIGGDGEDRLVGGADDDILNGGIGNDTLLAQSGDDTINGGDGEDLITGQFGADTIDGGADNDNIFAGAGDDIVFGGTGDDIIRGEGQDDELHGGDGVDTITGGGGRDTIFGDAGNDTIFGQGGLDIIEGGTGDDILSGGTGNDVIFGNEDDDTLFGSEGNDALSGGSGRDILNGGTGNDTFVFGLGFENDSVTGFANDVDTLNILGSEFGIDTVAELLDPANGYVTQVDANTVRFDFGAGDTFTVNGESDFTIADLADDILLG